MIGHKRNRWIIGEQARPPQVTFERRDLATPLLVTLVVAPFFVGDVICGLLSSFSFAFAPETLLILSIVVVSCLVLAYGCGIKLVVAPAGITIAWTWYSLALHTRRYPPDCRIELECGNWDLEPPSGVRIGLADMSDLNDEVWVPDYTSAGELASQLERARETMRGLSE